MIQFMLAALLVALIVAAVVLLLLLYTDHVHFVPRSPYDEPTEFEKASQELADNMQQLQREIGNALEPSVRRMAHALNEVGKAIGGKK